MALDARRESHGGALTAKGALPATEVPTRSLRSLEGSGLALQALPLGCLGLTLQQAQYEGHLHFPSCPLVGDLQKTLQMKRPEKEEARSCGE